MKKVAFIFTLFVMVSFLVYGVSKGDSHLLANPTSGHYEAVKYARDDNGQNCQDSPLVVNPPNDKNFYIGKLSEKDLKQWSSKHGSRDDIPAPNHKKCHLK